MPPKLRNQTPMHRINQTDEQAAASAVTSPPAGDDILADVMYRIAERAQVAALILLEVEQEIRRDYCGERPYIAAQRGDYKAYISNRNTCILRDHRKGESMDLLARRYGVTKVRIWQVIHAATR